MLRAQGLVLALSLTACGSSEDGGGTASSGGAGGSAGAGGTSSAVELASAEVPASLSVRSGDLFFTDVRFDGAQRFAVVNRVPKTGGATTTVAELAGGLSFFGIAAQGQQVAWVGFDAQVAGGSVFGVPSTGLAPVVLVPNQGAPIAITADASSLFWVNLSPGAVMSGSETATPSELAADGQDSSSCLALAGQSVVWLSRQGGSRISRVPISGGAPTVLVEGDDGGGIGCLAADDEFVFFTRYGTSSGGFEPTYNHDGSVYRVALTGGSAEELAKGFEAPHGIAVRGDFVYFVSSQDGSLHRVPRGGGAVTTLAAATGASDSFRTQSVAADSAGVYWISGKKIWGLAAP
ncbi:MAG: hypothetical protein IPI67_16575 [Myxococcales bacterium]|nr:hypothetical protein [Myxococcales bacterium]